MVSAGTLQAPTFLSISDDLTGAVACASELWVAGCEVAVKSPAPAAWPVGHGAVVLDTSSRRLSPDDASNTVSTALEAWLDGSCGQVDQVYKRIDSGLRGNVAVEISAVRDALRIPFVIAAAAPALGITTRGGVQYLHGQEVIESRYGGAESPASSRIAQVLDRDATCLKLEIIREADLERVLRDAFATRMHVVCDAETPTDLIRIATATEALRGQGKPCVLVGSYGLAGAWARAAGMSRVAASRGVLVVGGSQMSTSSHQLEAFREMGAADHAGDVLESAARLHRGQDVIITVFASERPTSDRDVQSMLVREVQRLLAEVRPRGVVIVGGEAASAVVRACDVERTEVWAEPWPATPLVVFRGGALDGVPGVIKSGALGDSYWLVHAASLLRHVDRKVNS